VQVRGGGVVQVRGGGWCKSEGGGWCKSEGGGSCHQVMTQIPALRQREGGVGGGVGEGRGARRHRATRTAALPEAASAWGQ